MTIWIADWRLRLGAVAASMLLLAGCAAGRAFRQADTEMRAGNLDAAVAAYRQAVQAAPDNANYKIALQRAMLAASRAHLDKAREFERQDQLEAALSEYKLASEYDPSNQSATAKVAEVDRTIRERIEASRPKPAIEQMRERARVASAPPMINPASREPLKLTFTNTSLRDILNTIANVAGINITYDRDIQDRAVTVSLDQVTLEQALNQLMTMNQLSYKVVNDRSIFVFPDTNIKHAQYDEQVVRTFYLSHADATEMTQLLSSIVRIPQLAVQPAIAGNKTANTLTVRATDSMMQILEKIIRQNDKPRAEIVVDVEILEVDRTRAKQYGLNLSEYGVGGIFSPGSSPISTTTSTGAGTGTTGGATGGTTTTSTGGSTGPSQVKPGPPFNLNTISRGVTTADFYLAVPTAIVRFLESDTRNRVIAKPQLRGAEGSKLSLKIGDQVPVISTSYTPIATGGAGVNPLSSYQYKDVGVIIDMTPTVTLEGEIRLDLQLTSSTRNADVIIGGVNIPSFGNREITTRLRLRDGESNLLAGLLQEKERKSLQGFPGAIHVPVLRELFSANDQQIDQTDIVMLLTPHIVRTHEITEEDLKPVYIGSQQNLVLGGGPPPLIAPQQEQQAPPAPAPGTPQPGFVPPTSPDVAPVPGAPAAPNAPPGVPGPATPQPVDPQRGGGVIVAPPGSSPIPGTVLVQPPAAPPATPDVTAPGATTAPPASTPPTSTLPASTPAPPTTPPTSTPPTSTPAPPTTPPASTLPASTPAPPTTPPPSGGVTPATPPGATSTPVAPTPPAPRDNPQAATAPPVTTSPGVGGAQVTVSIPSTPFRVGGGPYTVPISITGASRISTMTLTLIYDPTRLRVRTVSEGSFMRAGGVNVTFGQQVNGNRIDITIARAADATGASGTGSLAAVLFDAIAPGPVTLSLSGTASGPGGTAMGLRFSPVSITVQP